MCKSITSSVQVQHASHVSGADPAAELSDQHAAAHKAAIVAKNNDPRQIPRPNHYILARQQQAVHQQPQGVRADNLADQDDHLVARANQNLVGFMRERYGSDAQLPDQVGWRQPGVDKPIDPALYEDVQPGREAAAKHAPAGIIGVDPGRMPRKQLEQSLELKYGKAALDYAQSRQDKYPARLEQDELKVRLDRDARDFAETRREHAGLQDVHVGGNVGYAKYRKNELFGAERRYIVTKQKDSGRDPGVYAFENPFLHPESSKISAKGLREAYRSSDPEQKSFAQQKLVEYFSQPENINKLAQPDRDYFLRALNDINVPYDADGDRQQAALNLEQAAHSRADAMDRATTIIDRHMENLPVKKHPIFGWKNRSAEKKLWRDVSKHHYYQHPNCRLTPRYLMESLKNEHGDERKQEAVGVLVRHFNDLRAEVSSANEGDKDYGLKMAFQGAADVVLEEKKQEYAETHGVDVSTVTDRQARPLVQDKDVMATYFNALEGADRHDFLMQAGRAEVRRHDPDAAKMHMIKGDYAESDRNFLASAANWIKVRVFGMSESRNWKSIRISNKLAEGKMGKALADPYRTYAAETRYGANAGVVKEALATDLTRELGKEVGKDTPTYVTQDYRVAQSEWDNGYPKLMADITLIDGAQTRKAFNDVNISPKERFDDFEGKLVDGRLVNQVKDRPGGDYQNLDDDVKINKKTGRLKSKFGKRAFYGGYHVSQFKKTPNEPIFKEGTHVEGLGRATAKLLIMGDRDALGGSGANKGFVANRPAAIDPGHAFETEINQINDDFSFKQPSNGYQKKLKNFTIFDSAPLSEKMRGVQDIKAMHDSRRDMRLFEQYEDKWDGGDNERLNFQEPVKEWRAAYQKQKQVILDTFADRLQVYDFAGLSEPQKDAAFDILDAFEKLTSECDWKSENGLVELNRPRIIPDKDGNPQRVKWSVSQHDGDRLKYQTTFKSEEERDKIVERLQAVGVPCHVNDNDKTIALLIRNDNLENMAAPYTGERLIQVIKDREAAA